MFAWGGIASDLPSRVIAAEWNLAQQKANRDITYQRRGKTWFVVSGTDVEGIEFYEKFIMRGQQVAFMDITYPKSRSRQYDAWVERIEDGFGPVGLRGGWSELPHQSSSRSEPDAAVRRTPAAPGNPADLARTRPTTKPSTTLTKLPETKETPELKAAPSATKTTTAEKVPGKPGFVYSPFSSDQRMVDVKGVPAGTKVKCPYTMKIFLVP